MKRFRSTIKSGIGPATFVEAFDVPISLDNLVCIHCGAEVGAVPYVVVSSPKRKGILAFACPEHVSEAMAYISRALEMGPPPTDVKLPDERDN